MSRIIWPHKLKINDRRFITLAPHGSRIPYTISADVWAWLNEQGIPFDFRPNKYDGFLIGFKEAEHAFSFKMRWL